MNLFQTSEAFFRSGLSICHPKMLKAHRLIVLTGIFTMMLHETTYAGESISQKSNERADDFIVILRRHRKIWQESTEFDGGPQSDESRTRRRKVTSTV